MSYLVNSFSFQQRGPRGSQPLNISGENVDYIFEKLKVELAMLRRARYGRSSKKLDEKIEQMGLLIDDMEETEAQSAVIVPRLCIR